VRQYTRANTTAWTPAFIMQDPPAGRDNNTPGVRTKKRTAT